MNTVIIKNIEKQDFKDMEELYSVSLKDNQKGFIQDPSFRGGIKEFVSSLNTNKGILLGLYSEDKLIGMGALKKHNNSDIELCKLHLCPGYKGKGYGKMLALALINKAIGLEYQRLILHVTKTQEAAIGLYCKLGFQKTKEELSQIEVSNELLDFDTVFMEMNLKK